MAHKQQPKDKYTVGRTLSSGVSKHSDPAHTHLKEVMEPAEPVKKSAWKKWLAFVLLLLFVPVLVIGTWDGVNYSRASQKLFGSSNLLAGLAPAQLKGQDGGRVNIMVVGYSADDPGHAGANLTDSIMVISLSTSAHTGYMLSIPRDLYVSIPGYSRAKINEAYQDGQASNFSEAGYPAGGMGLLEKTVSQTLGIQTNYYALVDYTAVRGTTDALNGITVNIQSSDPRGIYDPNFKPQEGGPLRLPNGLQKIDGLTALRLTRARGAAGGSYGLAQSDFDRTKNQQAVFAGIKSAINWSVLLNPTKNSKLLDASADNIHTDVTINEALPLYRLFHAVPDAQMKSITLRDFNGKNLLGSYTTPSGQAALIPLAGINGYSDIRAAINGLNQ